MTNLYRGLNQNQLAWMDKKNKFICKQHLVHCDCWLNSIKSTQSNQLIFYRRVTIILNASRTNTRHNLSGGIILLENQQAAGLNTRPRYLYYVVILRLAYVRMYGGQIFAMWVQSTDCSVLLRPILRPHK